MTTSRIGDRLRPLASALLAGHPLIGGLLHLPIGLWKARPDPWLWLFLAGSGMWALGQLDRGIGMFFSILAQGVGGWLVFRGGQRLLAHWSYGAVLAGVGAYAFIRWLDRPFTWYREQLWSFNPNALGAWLALGGAISALLVRPGWLALVGYLGAGLGIWATGSRMSAGTWVLAGVLAPLLRLPRRKLRFVTAGLTVLVVLAMFTGESVELGRFRTTPDPGFRTTQQRLELYRVAWQAFLQNPLTGVPSFAEYFQANPTPRARELRMAYQPHAHNLLLQALAEGGLLAGAGLAIWLGRVTWLLVISRAWPGLAILTVAIVLNLFDFTFATAEVYFPLWIAIGWSVAASSTTRTPPAPASPHHGPMSDTEQAQPDQPTRGGGPT